MYSKKSHKKTDIQRPLAIPKDKSSMYCKKLSLLHIFFYQFSITSWLTKNIQSWRRGGQTNKHVFCHFRWQHQERVNLLVPLRFFLVFQHLASCLSTIDPHKKASFLHFIGPVVQCCRSPKMHTIPISIKARRGREKISFLCSFSSFGTNAGEKMQVFMACKKWTKDALQTSHC